MTWIRGTRGGTPEERINRLICDGILGWVGPARHAQPIRCDSEITGVQTAAQARTIARSKGWHTSGVGDRCPNPKCNPKRRRPGQTRLRS